MVSFGNNAGTAPAKQANRKPPLTIEDARIIWRNFEGRKTQYNALGQRNFAVVIPAEDVDAMKADGWNVKTKEPNPEYPDQEPLSTLAVKVNFSGARPPRIVVIAGEDRQELDEDTVSMLDRVQIEKVDLIINPSYYDVQGRQGYSAYLRSIYVTIVQDELEKKYGSFTNSGAEENRYPDDSPF